MRKLNKKQKKALRNNGKRHASKCMEHRRRISNIIERRNGEYESHYLTRSQRFTWGYKW